MAVKPPGLDAWPTKSPKDVDVFLSKYESVEECHLKLTTVLKHVTLDTTLGERGAVPMMHRPNQESILKSPEKPLNSARDHWLHETPRDVNGEALEAQAAGQEEEEVRFTTGMSKRNIQTWDHVMQGYTSLAYYLVFFSFFLMFLLAEYRPAEMYLANAHIRGAILSEDANLVTVKDQASFWPYFIGEPESEEPFELRYVPTGEDGAQTKGGLLGALFMSQHYNDQVMEEADLGFDAGLMNKIVGGVLVVQERAQTNINEKSIYGPWFQGASPLSAAADREPFGVALTNSSAVDLGIIQGSETAPFLIAQADLQRETLKKAFTYDEEAGGFAHLFLASSARDEHLQLAWLLKDHRWLDKQTSAVKIKFSVYNGNLGLFIYCSLNLNFLRAGAIDKTDIASYTIQLKGINLEPGIVGVGKTLIECAFLCLVGYQLGQLLISVMVHVREGYDSEDGRAALIEFLTSGWTVLDVLNISLILYTFWVRYRFQNYMLLNPVEPLSPKLDGIFEESHDMQEQQLIISGINILLCILRFFSYYRFQEKLNVLTLTVRYAAIDLYHFCMQLFATFVLMALIGHFMFGTTNYNYSSVSMSLTSVLEMTVNNYDLAMMRRGSAMADPYMFFVSVFIAQIWFGCLMAILMNHFSRASAPSEEEEEVGGGGNLRTRGGKFTVAEQLFQGLQKFKKKQKTTFHKWTKNPTSDALAQTHPHERIHDEKISEMCQNLQDQGKADFNFAEGVEELLKLCPDEDKGLLMNVIRAKQYLFIESEAAPQNTVGFKEDVKFGDEVLFSEVELLQQENLRLRTVIKKYRQRVMNAISIRGSGAFTTIGKFKRGFLRKKGGNRGGTDWIERGSMHSPGVAWKWRWFVMTPRYFAYYMSASSPHPAYVLNWVDLKDIGIDVMGEEAEAALGAATFRSNAPATLRSSTSVADATSRASGYSFYLCTDSSRIEILCSDPQERADWLTAMRNTVAALLSEEETKNYYIDESRLADFRTKRRERKTANGPTASSAKKTAKTADVRDTKGSTSSPHKVTSSPPKGAAPAAPAAATRTAPGNNAFSKRAPKP